MIKKLFVGITIVITSLFISGCGESNNKDYSAAKEKGFVYVEGNRFMQNDSVFFPVLINYLVEFMKIEDQLIPVTNIQYDSTHKHEGVGIEGQLERLKTHFKYINHLGFNTIRLVGLGGQDYNENGEFTMKCFNIDDSFSSYPYKEIKEQYKQAVVKIIELAEANDLRVMILFPTHRLDERQNESRIAFIKDIMSLFKENNTVFSYDFFNEPLYFDNSENEDYKVRQRSKESAFKVVTSWADLMAKYAPNQLSTIGFGEPLEVFEWDPSILPIDFVSFHTYHPLRVPNEIYWWSKYINKPWMITETSLPADNDSISYLEQRQFMIESYKRTVNCGGGGFGWWQYQDVDWGNNFEHNHTSLIDHTGITYFEDSSEVIFGTPKDAAMVLKDLLKYTPTYECECAPNYYNMLGYKNIKIEGNIINAYTGEPIEGAVIRGWTNYWRIASNTFTNSKGEFNIFSNDEYIHFEISAPGFTKIKFDQRIAYRHKDKNASAFTTLYDKKLEYHDIHYYTYLKKQPTDSLLLAEGTFDSTIVFDFDPNLFNQFQFVGIMGTKMLYPLDFIVNE